MDSRGRLSPHRANKSGLRLAASSFLSKISGGVKRVKRDWKRENSNPAESVRLPHPRSIDRRDRRDGAAHRSADRRADSTAHDEKQVLRAAFAARGQEIAG